MSGAVLCALDVVYGSNLAPPGFRRIVRRSGDAVNLSDSSPQAISLWASFSATVGTPITQVRIASTAQQDPNEAGNESGQWKRIARDVTGKNVFLECYSAGTSTVGPGAISALMFVAANEGIPEDQRWEELLTFPGTSFKLVCTRVSSGPNGSLADGAAASALGAGDAATAVSWLHTLEGGTEVDVKCSDGLWRTGYVCVSSALSSHPPAPSPAPSTALGEDGAQSTVTVAFTGWPERFNETVPLSFSSLSLPGSQVSLQPTPNTAYIRAHKSNSAAHLAPPKALHAAAARLAAVTLGHVQEEDASVFLLRELPLVLTQGCIANYVAGARDLPHDKASALTAAAPAVALSADEWVTRAGNQASSAPPPSATPWKRWYEGCRQGEGSEADSSRGVDNGPVQPGHACFPGSASLYDSPPPVGPAALTRAICTMLSGSGQPKNEHEYGAITSHLQALGLAWATVHLRAHSKQLHPTALLFLKACFLIDLQRADFVHAQYNITLPSQPLAAVCDGWAGRLCGSGASRWLVSSINRMHEAGGFVAIIDRLQAHAKECSESEGGKAPPCEYHASGLSLEEDAHLIEIPHACRYLVNRAFAVHYSHAYMKASLARLESVQEVHLKRTGRDIMDAMRKSSLEAVKQFLDWYADVHDMLQVGGIGYAPPAKYDQGFWAGNYDGSPPARTDYMLEAMLGGPLAVPAHAASQPAPGRANAVVDSDRGTPVLYWYERSRLTVAFRFLRCEALALRVKGLTDIHALVEGVLAEEKYEEEKSKSNMYSIAAYNSSEKERERLGLAPPGRLVCHDRAGLLAVLREGRVMECVLLGAKEDGSKDVQDLLPVNTGRGDVDGEAAAAAIRSSRISPPHVSMITRLSELTTFMAECSSKHRTARMKAHAQVHDARKEVAAATGPAREQWQSALAVREEEARAMDKVVQADAQRTLTAVHLVLLWDAWASQPGYDEMSRAVLGLLSAACPHLSTYQHDVLYGRLAALPMAAWDEALVEWVGEYTRHALKQWRTEIVQGQVILHGNSAGGVAYLQPVLTGQAWLDTAWCNIRDWHHWYGCVKLWEVAQETGGLPLLEAQEQAHASVMSLVPPPSVSRREGAHGTSPQGLGGGAPPSVSAKALTVLVDLATTLPAWKAQASPVGSPGIIYPVRQGLLDRALACIKTESTSTAGYIPCLPAIRLCNIIFNQIQQQLCKKNEKEVQSAQSLPSVASLGEEEKEECAGKAKAEVARQVRAMQDEHAVFGDLCTELLRYMSAAVLSACKQGIQVSRDRALACLQVGSDVSAEQAQGMWAAACAACSPTKQSHQAPVSASSRTLCFASRFNLLENVLYRLAMLTWWAGMAEQSIPWPVLRSLWQAGYISALTVDARSAFLQWLRPVVEETAFVMLCSANGGGGEPGVLHKDFSGQQVLFIQPATLVELFRTCFCSGADPSLCFDPRSSDAAGQDILWLMMRAVASREGLLYGVDSAECLLTPVLPGLSTLWAVALYAEDDTVSRDARNTLINLFSGYMLMLPHGYSPVTHGVQAAQLERDDIRAFQEAAEQEGLTLLNRVSFIDLENTSHRVPGQLVVCTKTTARCAFLAMLMAVLREAQGVTAVRTLDMLAAFLADLRSEQEIEGVQIIRPSLALEASADKGGAEDALTALKEASIEADLQWPQPHFPAQLRPDASSQQLYSDSPITARVLSAVVEEAMRTHVITVTVREQVVAQAAPTTSGYYSNYNVGPTWKAVALKAHIRPSIETLHHLVCKLSEARGVPVSQVLLFVKNSTNPRPSHTRDHLHKTFTEVEWVEDWVWIAEILPRPSTGGGGSEAGGSEGGGAQGEVPSSPCTRQDRAQQQLDALCKLRYRYRCRHLGVRQYRSKRAASSDSSSDGEDDVEEEVEEENSSVESEVTDSLDVDGPEDEEDGPAAEGDVEDEPDGYRDPRFARLASGFKRNFARSLYRQERSSVWAGYTVYCRAHEELWAMPRMMLTERPQYFDQLFGLLSQSSTSAERPHADPSVISLAWSLISSLPVSAQLNKQVETVWGCIEQVDGSSPPAWDTILSPSSPLKLLYLLNVMLRTVSKEAGGEGSPMNTEWSRALVRSGGLAHLCSMLLTVHPGQFLAPSSEGSSSTSSSGQAGLLQECAAVLLRMVALLLLQDSTTGDGESSGVASVRSFTYKASPSSPPIPCLMVDRAALVSRMLTWLSYITTADVPSAEGQGGGLRAVTTTPAHGTPTRPGGNGMSTSRPALSSPTRSVSSAGGLGGSRQGTPRRTPVRPTPSRKGAAEDIMSPVSPIAGFPQQADRRGDASGDGLFPALTTATTTTTASGGEGQGANKPASGLASATAAPRTLDVILARLCMRVLVACVRGTDVHCDVSHSAPSPSREVGQWGTLSAAPHAQALSALRAFPAVSSVLAAALLCPCDKAVRGEIQKGLLALVSQPGAGIAAGEEPVLPTPVMDIALWLANCLLEQHMLCYSFPTQCSQFWEVVSGGAGKEQEGKGNGHAKGAQAGTTGTTGLIQSTLHHACTLVDYQWMSRTAGSAGLTRLAKQVDKVALGQAQAAAANFAVRAFPVMKHIQALCSALRSHPVVETGANAKEEHEPSDELLVYLLQTLALLLCLPSVDGDVREWVGRPREGPDMYTPAQTAHGGPGMGLVDELFYVCLFTLPGSSGGGSSVPSVLGAALPRCKIIDGSRQAAVDLLEALCTHCLPNAARVCTLFLQHHDPHALGLPAFTDDWEGASVAAGKKAGKGAKGAHALTTAGKKGKAANRLGNLSPLSSTVKEASLHPLPWTHPQLQKRIQDKEARSATVYAGLKNLGCICYMNASLQQFYMTYRFKSAVLSYTAPAGASGVEAEDDMPLQLKLLFAQLQETATQWIDPSPLMRAIKDWDGNPTNPLEQKDVPEFMTKLFSDWEMATQGTALATMAKDCYGGVQVQELLAQTPAGTASAAASAPLYRARDEEYYFLQVRVKNNPSLAHALEQYCAGETVDYKWTLPGQEGGDSGGATGGAMGGESSGAPKDVSLPTVKRTSIRATGPCLMIHLSRFDFDLERLEQVKLNDRFEFPRTLDMWPYTVWGRPDAQAGAQGAGAGGVAAAGVPEEAQESTPPPRADFQYELVGVVVHMGTAVGGHYYSYIRERDSSLGPQPGDAWYQFNDTSVTAWEASEEALDRECYGGQEAATGAGAGKARHGWANTSFEARTRTANAFCLFYERVGVQGGQSGQAAAEEPAAQQEVLRTVPSTESVTSPILSPPTLLAPSPCLVRAPAHPLAVHARLMRQVYRGGSEKARASHRVQLEKLDPVLAASLLEENTSFWRIYYIFRMAYFHNLLAIAGRAAEEARELAEGNKGGWAAYPKGVEPAQTDGSTPLLSVEQATSLGGPLFPVFRLAVAFLLNTMPEGNELALSLLQKGQTGSPAPGGWLEAIETIASACPTACVWFLSTMFARPLAVQRTLTDPGSHVVQREVLEHLLRVCMKPLWRWEVRGMCEGQVYSPVPAYAPGAHGRTGPALAVGGLSPPLFSTLAATVLPAYAGASSTAPDGLNLLCTLITRGGHEWSALAVRAGLVCRLVDLLLGGYPASPLPGINAETRPVGIQGLLDWPQGVEDSVDEAAVLAALRGGSGTAAPAGSGSEGGSSAESNAPALFEDTAAPVLPKSKLAGKSGIPVLSSMKGTLPRVDTSLVGVGGVGASSLAMVTTGGVKGKPQLEHEVREAILAMVAAARCPSGRDDSPVQTALVDDSSSSSSPLPRPTLSPSDMLCLSSHTFLRTLPGLLLRCGEAGKGKPESKQAYYSIRSFLGHLLWGIGPHEEKEGEEEPAGGQAQEDAHAALRRRAAGKLLHALVDVIGEGSKAYDWESQGPYARLAVLLTTLGDSPSLDSARAALVMPVLLQAMDGRYYRAYERQAALLAWAGRNSRAIAGWFATPLGSSSLRRVADWLQTHTQPPASYPSAVGHSQQAVVLCKPGPSLSYNVSYAMPPGRDPELLHALARLALGRPTAASCLDLEDEPESALNRRIRIAEQPVHMAMAHQLQARAGSPRTPGGTSSGHFRYGRVKDYYCDHVASPVIFVCELEPDHPSTPKSPLAVVAARGSPTAHATSAMDARKLALYDPRVDYAFVPPPPLPAQGAGEEEDGSEQRVDEEEEALQAWLESEVPPAPASREEEEGQAAGGREEEAPTSTTQHARAPRRVTNSHPASAFTGMQPGLTSFGSHVVGKAALGGIPAGTARAAKATGRKSKLPGIKASGTKRGSTLPASSRRTSSSEYHPVADASTGDEGSEVEGGEGEVEGVGEDSEADSELQKAIMATMHTTGWGGDGEENAPVGNSIRSLRFPGGGEGDAEGGGETQGGSEVRPAPVHAARVRRQSPAAIVPPPLPPAVPSHLYSQAAPQLAEEEGEGEEEDGMYSIGAGSSSSEGGVVGADSDSEGDGEAAEAMQRALLESMSAQSSQGTAQEDAAEAFAVLSDSHSSPPMGPLPAPQAQAQAQLEEELATRLLQGRLQPGHMAVASRQGAHLMRRAP